MTYHLIGLPHTKTHLDYSSCAFTIKILNMVNILKDEHVIHYGAASGLPIEEVVTITEQEQRYFFPEEGLPVIGWSGTEPYWRLFNDRTAQAINARKKKGDIVLVAIGKMMLPLVEAIEGGVQIVESGIGYTGCLPRKAGRYRVYESYAHMNKIWGAEGGFDADGYFYDTVIPNSFNLDLFPFQAEKGDYYLYLGRTVPRKGIHIAQKVCEVIGAKLIVAGPGGGYGTIGCKIGKERAELYQNAKATFVPTIYCEPFGGVAVEAQLCGTPVITTDWGAFPETVEQGKTGFRCRTLRQFIEATRQVGDLDPYYIRRHAERYSIENVAPMYHEYFDSLKDLWGQGWYAHGE